VAALGKLLKTENTSLAPGWKGVLSVHWKIGSGGKRGVKKKKWVVTGCLRTAAFRVKALIQKLGRLRSLKEHLKIQKALGKRVISCLLKEERKTNLPCREGVRKR